MKSNEGSTHVEQSLSSLCQSSVLECLGDCQVNHKSSVNFSKTWVDPQKIAVTVLFCQAFPTKKVFEVLSRFNVCHNYKYQLRNENYAESFEDD